MDHSTLVVISKTWWKHVLPAGSQSSGSYHITVTSCWFQPHHADHFLSDILPGKPRVLQIMSRFNKISFSLVTIQKKKLRTCTIPRSIFTYNLWTDRRQHDNTDSVDTLLETQKCSLWCIRDSTALCSCKVVYTVIPLFYFIPKI